MFDKNTSYTNENIELFVDDANIALHEQHNGFGKRKIEKSKPDHEIKWSNCLTVIRDNITENPFKTWFIPLKPLRYERDTLTLKVPSQFFLEWIEENYYDLLQKTVFNVFGENTLLDFEIVVEKASNTLEERTIKVDGKNQQKSLSFDIEKKTEDEYPETLNSRYQFDNFVIGDSNQLASSATQAVSEKPLHNRYCPLFIYGNSGLGKTHLLQAIGNSVRRNEPKLKVLYLSSEKFYTDFIDSIRDNKVSKFMAFYRNIDVLLIDDIHILAGKDKTQDNFFYIFNALYQAGKLIVITSDRSPVELKDIDNRLISRFQQGLCVDIKPPEFETRVAIILKKAKDEGIEIPMDVVSFIAQNVVNNVRQLEGTLISILAKVAFDHRQLNVELAREVIGANNVSSEEKVLTIDVIKQLVSNHYSIHIDEMESLSRKHEIALARQMAMYLGKKLTMLSLKKIGAAFGKRDHSTVLHSIKTIDNYIFTDPVVKKDCRVLTDKCQEYL